MARLDIGAIVTEIDAVGSLGVDELTRLELLIGEFFGNPDAAKHVDVWFRLYERFPNDDGYGLFWSILHGIEALPGSETEIVASVVRHPTHFPLSMVNRMLNAGIETVDRTDLLDLIHRVANDESASPTVRADANNFLSHQLG